MGQVLHGSASTTAAIRRAIQNSQESLRALAKRHGVNPKTVAKWRGRSSTADVRPGSTPAGPAPMTGRSTIATGGGQYLAMNYTQRLAEANLVPSVGSVGDSYDNALAETINGLYKAEVIWRQRSWPSASAVEIATLRWVDWFNHHRLFGPIGHIPPAEAEANYYAANETLDMVA